MHKRKKIWQLLIKFVTKYGLFCFAAVILLLNYSLAFDNVVWGDEAFSGNTIRGTNLYGIFERVYYWDSHPPLYYYWLRLLADIFGYSTPVYHFAALIPFTVGVVIALFPIRKKFGHIPAAFFIMISGLAAPCVEYNLEIRMYALLFMEVLICAYCSYRILENGEKKSLWIILTLFGVAAAYTHYFGLVTSGILLFVTSLVHFLRNRGKSWLNGVVTILAYLLLYTPWLTVFFRQATTVSNNWWLTEIAPISVLTTIIFCGENMKAVLLPITVILSVIIFVVESEIVHLTLTEDRKSISWKFTKPATKNWSMELYGIVVFWSVIVLTIGFTYVASVVINPLTTARYMYPLVPLTLFILMLNIRRLLAYGRVHWANETYGEVEENTEPEEISLVNTKSVFFTRAIAVIVALIFASILVIGLLDFKYYRSVCKTHEAETQRTLSYVGAPDEDTVFTSIGVKHLSWTVLQYYYPDNTVYPYMPNEIDTDAGKIWAFLGSAVSDDVLQQMADKGYSTEAYGSCWMGKYNCQLYLFYK